MTSRGREGAIQLSLSVRERECRPSTDLPMIQARRGTYVNYVTHNKVAERLCLQIIPPYFYLTFDARPPHNVIQIYSRSRNCDASNHKLFNSINLVVRFFILSKLYLENVRNI